MAKPYPYPLLDPEVQFISVSGTPCTLSDFANGFPLQKIVINLLEGTKGFPSNDANVIVDIMGINTDGNVGNSKVFNYAPETQDTGSTLYARVKEITVTWDEAAAPEGAAVRLSSYVMI